MINSIFNQTAIVKRRIDISVASRDVLNNPIYGAPTLTWQTIYSNMPCRFAFSSKPIQFAPTGERITPNGVCYLPSTYIIYHEDRILVNGIEYVVVSIVPAYLNNNCIDHFEASVELP